ncbi:MAG: MFS transporter [Nitriliruptorales bacterium]|nr:MFS transporter [Nitriliruptorales bacterium]
MAPFAVCLHVALIHGVLSSFFPLYGLRVGLSMGQIGALLGVHGAVAAGVRFLSGPMFRLVPYRKALPSMIVVNSAAVMLMGLIAAYPLFIAGWALVGLSRGVLRVASGALVMDTANQTDSQRGAASGIYLAGLDVGKVAGPAVGGVLVEMIGLPGVFIAVSLMFPVAYFVLASRVHAWSASRAA